MTTHPYIPLYVDDYESHTAHLTLEEDGVYTRLLRLCWRTPGCSLPDDPAWIARKIRLSGDDFERIARPVLTEFFTLIRGRWAQRRLKREYDNISRKKTARKLAGKKGGEAKARNVNEKSSSNATDLPAHARAFPEPYPEPEKEIDSGAQVLPFEPPAPQDAPPKGARQPRGSRLKPDWQPAAKDLEYATGEGFSLAEIRRMAENFRDYWTAATGAKATKADWSATWRTWVRNQRDRRPAQPQRKQVDWC